MCLTKIVTVAGLLLSAPWSSLAVNVNFKGVSDGRLDGAVKVGEGVLTPFNVTGGPAICTHE